MAYLLGMSNTATRRLKLSNRLSLLRRSDLMGFPLTQAEISEIFEIKRKLSKKSLA